MTVVSEEVETLRIALEDVRAVVDRKPQIALVLGSGLGSFADSLDDRVAISYEKIRGIPRSTVVGHEGNLVFGKYEGVEVVAMQGRVHMYEGHRPQAVVFGLRLMLQLGAESVIITNAAGGIGEDLEVGDLMLITDQLNLTGVNCLVGENVQEWGPRFVDMTTAYDSGYREFAHAVASENGIALKEGVYVGVLGPSYETPAEIRMFRTLGGGSVGMSTVQEVIAARHMGARVVGISCITNKAAGLGHETLSHDEVKEAAAAAHQDFVRLVGGLIKRIGNG